MNTNVREKCFGFFFKTRVLNVFYVTDVEGTLFSVHYLFAPIQNPLFDYTSATFIDSIFFIILLQLLILYLSKNHLIRFNIIYE